MKTILRKKIIQLRKDQTPENIAMKSQLILEQLIKLHWFKAGMKVLSYMDFRNEVQTQQINQYILNHHMTLLLPRVHENNQLSIHTIQDLDHLQTSSLGILEPNEDDPTIKADEIDVVILPGVAFDQDGYRLGYGGGYYDRLLAELPKDTLLIAVAFELQMVQQVPREAHDMPMDIIVTEKNTYRRQGHAST